MKCFRHHWVLAVCLAVSWTQSASGQEPSRAIITGDTHSQKLSQFVESHCLDCHNRVDHTAGLAFEELLSGEISQNPESWEKVARRLSFRDMPPNDVPRPTEQMYVDQLTWLESTLDRFAAEHPQPGRTEPFRRLTSTEYHHAIRDLLAIDVDVSTLLPPDESSHGFDNVTVTGLSPTLLNRYLAAAEKISKLAVGRAGRVPGGETVRLRPDITQDTHVEGLPFGTRGGALFPYHFPQDGTYEIQVHLMRDRNEGVEGLKEPHELLMLLDRNQVAQLTVAPPPNGQSDKDVDANLKTRLTVKAGEHALAVTFLKKSSALLETARQPLNVHFNYYRHPRLGPAIYEISVIGPFEATGPGETESRRRIFICRPTEPDHEEGCAKKILSSLMRRAYRQPVSEEDLKVPLPFYREGREEGDFETGIERALSAILVNPRFLFRIEADPVGLPPQSAYRVSDLELASRLSFFLWSSIPDDELLTIAEQGRLREPEVLEAQVRRMLSDRRSQALVTNFARQWLYLKNLDSVTPDMRLFPDFDHNLRDAFRRETELFFESTLRHDESVLSLIHADYTFLNERLAKHYGIPNVYGSRFRRVELGPESHRGGLLRHGSILTVTSYATRTSPVIRGKWVLENLLSSPPPPPPPNVPALEDNTVSASLPIRERLAAHRENPSCASCHRVIDPVGFSLENFDAVGRWRTMEDGLAIDSSGGLPDGSQFAGVKGLEDGILARPENFVRSLTEKLLTYALGRGLEYHDGPAVRKILTQAKQEDYRFSSLILGIVTSTPFQMRSTD